jgi:hypothetical protein
VLNKIGDEGDKCELDKVKSSEVSKKIESMVEGEEDERCKMEGLDVEGKTSRGSKVIAR